jgi:AraC-like DNA-binding protein/mannose-6-phosphate isomerase-like protein (cupin superfamily)
MRNGKSVVSTPAAGGTGTRSVAITRDPTAVEFNVWRSERIAGLEVIDTNTHQHAYPPHLHDTLEIIWIRSGSAQLTCQGRIFDLQAGEAAIIPPNEIHSGGRLGSTLRYVAIHLPRVLVEQVFCDFKFLVDGAGNPAPVKLLSREKATSLLPITVSTVCADLPADRLLYIMRPILCQLLDLPLADSGPVLDRSDLHPAVSKAQSIIRDQCADRMHVSHLARCVDLDMRYLISLFKLATGVTPHQFQIAMRVELARALLEQQLPLSEVAARAGFADQSHLNRHFRRQYGFTPGAFRESVVASPGIVL